MKSLHLLIETLAFSCANGVCGIMPTLTEVQIAQGQLCTGYINWQERLRSTTQVFDVAISSMFLISVSNVYV